nr:hypothetical protein [Actinospica acidiphila]
MTSCSNSRWLIRVTAHLPSKAPGTTNSTSAASSSKESASIRPRPALKGSLDVLTMRKKNADVPRKPSFRKPAESRYIDITGPPALATMVVNPPRTP